MLTFTIYTNVQGCSITQSFGESSYLVLVTSLQLQYFHFTVKMTGQPVTNCPSKTVNLDFGLEGYLIHVYVHEYILILCIILIIE